MSKTGLQARPKVRRSMKEVSPMEDKKIYLLAELTIRPGFLEEVKAILKEALIPTLQYIRLTNPAGSDPDPGRRRTQG
jgi:hypothetical protein